MLASKPHLLGYLTTHFLKILFPPTKYRSNGLHPIVARLKFIKRRFNNFVIKVFTNIFFGKTKKRKKNEYIEGLQADTTQ